MNPEHLTTTFEPVELAFLQRVLRGVCEEHGVQDDGGTARDLAERLIELYQQGVREEDILQSEVKNHPLLRA